MEHPTAVYIGDVYGSDLDNAVVCARDAYPNHRPLSLVAAVTWRSLTVMERQVFLGTFIPPAEAETEPNGARVSICRACRLPIIQHFPAGQKRQGRPPQWHDECAPPAILRFRKYGRKRERS